MDLQFTKKYLQSYLDQVLNSRYSKKIQEFGPESIEFTIHDILKGSFESEIIHVFLDSNPEMKKSYHSKPWAVLFMKNVEGDIEDFLKTLSIRNKIKIHWNKRPIFNNASLSADY